MFILLFMCAVGVLGMEKRRCGDVGSFVGSVECMLSDTFQSDHLTEQRIMYNNLIHFRLRLPVET